jgi:hypothetical protein
MDKLKTWAKDNPKKAVVALVLVLAVLGGLASGASVS